jgi:riboflavin synthase
MAKNGKEISKQPVFEKAKITQIRVEDLLNKDFLSEMKDAGIKNIPVSLFIHETGSNSVITVGHQNPKEYDEKVVHVESTNPELLSKILKVLDKFRK